MKRKLAICAAAVFFIIGHPAQTQLIVQADDPEGIIRDVFGYPSSEGLLNELGYRTPNAAIGLGAGIPYHFHSSSGEQRWQYHQRRIQVRWPFQFFRQPVNLGFFATDQSADFGVQSFRHSSALRLDETRATTGMMFSHHFQRLRLRYGGVLSWRQILSKTYFDPRWEMAWGEEVTARFSVTLEQQTTLLPFRWRLNETEIGGSLPIIKDAAQYRIAFGDPFGVRVSLIGGDGGIRSFKPDQISLVRLKPSGEWREVGIYIEKKPESGIAWKMGGVHREIGGDAVIEIGERVSGEAMDIGGATDLWGGGIKGRLPDGSNWQVNADYGLLSGSADGWMIGGSLPDAFNLVIGGDRWFFSDAALQMLLTRGTLSRSFLGSRLNLQSGWIILEPKLKMSDYDPALRNRRVTETGIRRAQIAWLTLDATVTYSSWQLKPSISRMFLLSLQREAGVPRPSQEKFSGGWMWNLTLHYDFPRVTSSN